MKVESTRITGKVMAVSEPFINNDRTVMPLITVETKKGLYSIPVSDIHEYAINGRVEISLTICKL